MPLVLAALVVVLDQLVKRWVVANIALGGFRALLPGIVSLTYMQNSGAAFSLFAQHTWALAAVSLVVSLALIALILLRRFPTGELFALGMVLGGAVGNLIDRVALGYVVDMFNFEFVNFAIFNVADAFIDCGALLFAVLYCIRTFREEREAKSHAA